MSTWRSKASLFAAALAALSFSAEADAGGIRFRAKCSSSQVLYRNHCYAKTRSCTVSNGTGTQTFAKGKYGACTVVSCNAGYVRSGNSCTKAAPKIITSTATSTSTRTSTTTVTTSTRTVTDAMRNTYTVTTYQTATATAPTVKPAPPTITSTSTSVTTTTITSTATATATSTPVYTTTHNLSGPKWVAVPAALNSDRIGFPMTVTYSLAGGEQVICDFTDTAKTGNYDSKTCKAGDLYLADKIQLNTICIGTVTGCPTVETAYPFANSPDACGATLNASAHMLGDLNCATTEIGLRVVGDNLEFNGRGHSISAPAAALGVFVQGTGVNVHNVTVKGVTNAAALMAYNSDKLVIRDSAFLDSHTGLNVYSDNGNPADILIEKNNFSGNSGFGLRINGEVGALAANPVVSHNNFSGNKGYSLWIGASSVSLPADSGNTFSGAETAIGFSGGSFSADGLDLSQSGATKSQLNVFAADSVTITSSNLSYSAPTTPNQERIALSLYKVKQAAISGLKVNASDVAVKVTTEGGVASALTIKNSALQNSVVAGVMIQSYDATAFGNFDISNNDLRFNPAGMAIWKVNNAQVGAGSVFSNNQQ